MGPGCTAPSLTVLATPTTTCERSGAFGLTLTVASTGVFIVMSLRRRFRYWLVRLIFEQREQTDRVLGR